MMSRGSDLIAFRDGRVVPVAVLRRLWNLEERGLAIGLDDNGAVRVTPAKLLSDEDRAFLRQYRDAVADILNSGKVPA